MQPDVILVNPPYPTRPYQHIPFPPLGLGYLAAVLEKNNYKVDVVDCQASHLTYADFRQEIRKRKPNVVGVTSTTRLYNSALEICRITKEVFPECLTILGGSHVTFWDEEALNECPELDIVVRKEGEVTFLEIIQRLEARKNLTDIVGTTVRKDGKIVRNPDRPYIEDLDSLPFPARHLWPLAELRKVEDVFYLTTTRGCTYWCEFCAAVRMFGRRYRMRSIKNVVDEIEYLNKEYNATQFTFCDDAFTVDNARTEKLCEEIKKRNLKIMWNCGTRVDMVTKELLTKMRDTGCVSVWFGVESGSQEVLDEMHKGISTDQTLRAAGWVRELGMRPVPNALLGFPGETKGSAMRTIKFSLKVSPDDVTYFNIATPLPGTPLYDKVKEKGWLKSTNFDEYDCKTPVFETPMLDTKDLEELYAKAFRSFYLRPSYILRMFLTRGRYGFTVSKIALMYLIQAIKDKF
jgi:anaerobic magnesium-protoporphyrin IX monomethyl ester cyclase